MSETRVFIGRLTYKARDKDVKHFFRGFGKIIEISLKNGYGFVEFESSRDAEDAVHELNNCDLLGERVTVEHVKRLPRSSRPSFRSGGASFVRQDHLSRSSGRRYDSYYSKSDSSRGSFSDKRLNKYGPPKKTKYRCVVENLSSRVSWQDLKDYLREAAEVTYADAHKGRQNEGVVCFESRSDMKRAISRMDNKKINGRRIRLVPDKSVSRSRSRSRSRRRSRSSSSQSTASRSSSRSRSFSSSSNSSRSRSTSRCDSKSRSRSCSKARSSQSGSRSSASVEVDIKKVDSDTEKMSAQKEESLVKS